jgi:hypothetical protein
MMTDRQILDTTSEFDIRMVEGDPVGFSWIIEGVDWSGAYTFKCSTPGGLFTTPATAVVSGTDTLFTVSAAASTLLAPTLSGHNWSLKKDGASGTTRFKGLLFVDEVVA